MSMSIDNLKAAIELGYGPTMASHFQVIFTPPKALQTLNKGFAATELSILCQTVNLPGTQILTTDLPVYGPSVKMPYGSYHQDLVMSFLCTNSMAQRKIFDEWRRIIVDPTSNYVNYYDTYVGDIIVQKLDQEGRPSHSVIYEEAFPVSILEQELSSQANDWLRLTVVMAYRRWRSGADLYAAGRSNFGGRVTMPPAGDGTPYADDIFQNSTFPSVPEFKP